MWLNIVQIILGISLTLMILLQSKGAGLGSAFGSQSQTYHSKKGVEKAVFNLTIIIATLFAVTSLINFTL